ncbi:MAG: hypothetical protein CVV64_02000 [Candidatus Wallbacteria bacterium HGW-Wallbacteria-1]|jgi:HEAT repeat protein|uniref:HEAT repeat domain-containing protein n=1 Tax=Candidatus Wallbacteria bacterium HGW-Wallbacteria-1 TaxID=2013854 RepID=A0A2N1PV35_9BACT|nr:MAG: hypothetical protein CVV64_02000 [Candidatus Wallbacteria bacterium HGW-Wallbacteria-1]
MRENLLNQLKQGNEDERQAAAKELAAFPHEDTYQALLEATMDPDLSVRYFAKKSMRQVRKSLDNGGEEEKTDFTDEELEAMLSSTDFQIRVKSSTIIGDTLNKKLLRPALELLKKERNEYVIATIVKSVGRFGDSRAIPILKPFLAHYDARVRANTVEAMGYIQVPEVYSLVEDLLSDEDNRVRANVAKLLWKKDKLRVLEKIREMLKSGEEWMRDSAVYALGEIGTVESRDILLKILQEETGEGSEVIQRSIGKVERLIDEISYIEQPLTEIRKSAVPDMDRRELCYTIISDRGLDYKKRIKAIATLGEIDEVINIGRLLPLLETEDNEFVLSALVKFIGQQGGSSVLQRLKPLLLHPNPRVRANAVEGIAFADDPSIVDILMPYMEDRESRIAANAARAIWNYSPEQVSAKLLEMLRSVNPWMKTSAVYALGAINAPETRELLISAIRDTDPNICETARTVLQNLGFDIAEIMGSVETPAFSEERPSEAETGFRPGVGSAVDSSAAVSDVSIPVDSGISANGAAVSGIVSLGDEVAPKGPAPGSREHFASLMQSLIRSDPEERANFLQELTSAVKPEFLGLISATLNSSDDKYVRSMLVKLAGATGSSEAIDIIADYLSDEDSRVRANCIEGLSLIRDDRIVKLVAPLMEDSDSRVKANAARAIWEFSEIRALVMLREMLSTGEEHEKLSAIHALGEIGREEIITPLSQMLSDRSGQVIEKAVEAFDRIYGKGVLAQLDRLVEAGGPSGAMARELLDRLTVIRTQTVEVEKIVEKVVKVPAKEAPGRDAAANVQSGSGRGGFGAAVIVAASVVSVCIGLGTGFFIFSGTGQESVVDSTPARVVSSIEKRPADPVAALVWDLRRAQKENARDESLQGIMDKGLDSLRSAGQFTRGELNRVYDFSARYLLNNAVAELQRIKGLKDKGFLLWDEGNYEWISREEAAQREGVRTRQVEDTRTQEQERLERAKGYVPYENPDITPKTDAQSDVSLLAECEKSWDKAMLLGTPDKNSLAAVMKKLEAHFRLGEMTVARKLFGKGDYSAVRKEFERVRNFRGKGYILWDADSGEWKAP